MEFSRSLSVRATVGCAFTLLSSLLAAGQSNHAPVRITRAVDQEDVVTLGGHTHPLALPEYDRGPAPDDLPTERILLVLQRAPEQEAALRQLLEDQQVRSSPNYHKWLTPE